MRLADKKYTCDEFKAKIEAEGFVRSIQIWFCWLRDGECWEIKNESAHHYSKDQIFS